MNFRVGNKVDVIDGPFRGTTGVIEAIEGKCEYREIVIKTKEVGVNQIRERLIKIPVDFKHHIKKINHRVRVTYDLFDKKQG